MCTQSTPFVCNVVVTQVPTASFDKRKRTDGSEYSNGGATYIVYAGWIVSTYLAVCCSKVVKNHTVNPLNCK